MFRLSPGTSRSSWTADRLESGFGDLIAGTAGSLTFVAMHLAVFAVWVGINLMHGVRHFDPLPFSLLSTTVALEAILLASFILIRQARIGRDPKSVST